MVIDLITVVNIALSLIGLPPAVLLTVSLLKERTFIDDGFHRLNTVLILIFSGLGLASLLNIIVYSYLLYVKKVDTTFYILASIRTIAVNLFCSSFLWILLILEKYFRTKQ